MNEKPIGIEPLIAWLRDALKTTPYGEVGLLFHLRDGELTVAKRIHNETYKTDMQDELCRED